MIKLHMYNNKCVLDGPSDVLNKVANVLNRNFSYVPTSAKHQKEHLVEKLKSRNMPKYKIDNIVNGIDQRIYLFNKDEMSFPPGLLYSAFNHVRSIVKSDVKIIDHIEKHNKEYNWLFPKWFSPRPYQEHGLAVTRKILPSWHFMVSCMATGAGKTLDACMTIAEFGVKSMFVVPSALLLEQAYEKFTEFFGDEIGRLGCGYNEDAPIQIATTQTLFSICKRKDSRYDSILDTKLVLFDEVHRIPADMFYPLVWEFENAIFYKGYTATDRRKDGGSIKIEAASGYTHIQISPASLINDGFLVPPLISFERINMRPLPEIKGFYTDFLRDYHKYSKHQIIENDDAIERIANMARINRDNNKCTLVAVNKIEHGIAINAAIGDGSNLVTSRTPRAWDNIKAFRGCEFPILVSTLCGEGFNANAIESIIIAQDTTDSEQIVGRGLRLNSDKDACDIRHVYHYLPDMPKNRCGRYLTRHAWECRQLYKKLSFPIVKDLDMNDPFADKYL